MNTPRKSKGEGDRAGHKAKLSNKVSFHNIGSNIAIDYSEIAGEKFADDDAALSWFYVEPQQGGPIRRKIDEGTWKTVKGNTNPKTQDAGVHTVVVVVYNADGFHLFLQGPHHVR